MDTITIEILDSIGVFWDDPAIWIKTKNIPISYGDLIYSLMSQDTMILAANSLNISHRVLDRRLPGLFNDKPKSLKWSDFFLYKTERKVCPRCGELKKFNEFNKQKDSYTGLVTYCRECASARYKTYLSSSNVRVVRKAYLIDYYNTKKYIYTTYRKNNAGKINAWCAERRCKKIKATPAWSETKLISSFYENAITDMTVDHILPLQSIQICGLHVLNNLQYLSRADNSSKGNRIDLEEYNKQHIYDCCTIKL